jgi:hypothetical protein
MNHQKTPVGEWIETVNRQSAIVNSETRISSIDDSRFTIQAIILALINRCQKRRA